MTRPITQKQKSKRIQIELRRYKALELKVKGYSDRAIARELGVGVVTAHGDVHKILGQLAEKHVDEAANLRALLNLRYETLFHSYFDQAVSGGNEAAKTVMGILDRMAKINGLIPDKSLVTVDQRAMKFNEPVTFKIDGDYNPMGELAKRVYGGTG
tara:strand:+ start:478 stop:945 length:468 start_codon:yes stop_codon:yes gene_type:complete